MANDCKFPGNDFEKILLSRKDCFNRCVNTKICTHFTWSFGKYAHLTDVAFCIVLIIDKLINRNCHLKSGHVEKTMANKASNSICGIIPEILRGIQLVF